MGKLKLTLEREAAVRYGVWGTTRRAYDDCAYVLLNGWGYPIERFCAERFHAATGFNLKPGEKKRIEIEIKEVA